MRFKKPITAIISKGAFIITLFYTLAFGLIVLNDGIFFDDWSFYRLGKTDIISVMTQAGQPWVGYHNFLIFSHGNMLVGRALIFLCYLLSALLLYATLKSVKQISDDERLLISLLFALFPVNFARVCVAVSHYALYYLLFFAGIFTLSKYFSNRRLTFRLLSLLCLFFSFGLQSLLVFYTIVIIYIFYAEIDKKITVKRLIFIPLRYLDFFIAPAVFWIIKSFFFKPFGFFIGYNEITLPKLLSTRYNLNAAFYKALIDPLRESFSVFYAHPFLIIIAALFICCIIYKRYIRGIREEGSEDFFLFLFGFIAFLAGVHAYVAIGSLPSSNDWLSRYQMLVPLGASFIIFYFVKIFFNHKTRVLLYSLLLVLFVYINFLGYLEYQRDWFKQLSFIENMKTCKVVRENTTFLFEDAAKDLNARGRSLRFYELSGMMKYAFGDETRFGSLIEGFTNIGDFTNYVSYPEYNMSSYKSKNPEYKIIIKHGLYKLDRASVFKLYLKKIFKPEQFKEDIRKIIILEPERI